MSARTWHKGPPPHVGWWNASTHGSPHAWRWWDGDHWSVACDASYDCADVISQARKPSAAHEQQFIRWTTYWPKNARVPRSEG